MRWSDRETVTVYRQTATGSTKARVINLKDMTDFINFIEKTRVPENATVVSMDVRSLYTNVPQEEGIEKVCKAYDALISIKKKPPSPQNISKER